VSSTATGDESPAEGKLTHRFRGRAAGMDYIYIDNSNLYIEGRRVSAVAKKMAANIIEAMNNNILDNGYTISFGKLHDFLTGSDLSKIKRATLFGSRPPPNDSLWGVAKKAGFEVRLEDRNYSNKKKRSIQRSPP
jgi:hypothetical protein